VQASTWTAPDGTVYYALANVTAKQALVEIQIEAGLEAEVDRVQVTQIEPDGESLLQKDVRPGHWLKIDLKPYGLTCLRLDSHYRGRMKG
jgi:hypothetical protein